MEEIKDSRLQEKKVEFHFGLTGLDYKIHGYDADEIPKVTAGITGKMMIWMVVLFLIGFLLGGIIDKVQALLSGFCS